MFPHTPDRLLALLAEMKLLKIGSIFLHSFLTDIVLVLEVVQMFPLFVNSLLEMLDFFVLALVLSYHVLQHVLPTVV